jgi:cardiolipin synthase
MACISQSAGHLRHLGLVVFTLCCLLSASCASAPKVDGIINQRPSTETPIKLIDAHGPIPHSESKARLAKMASNANDSDLLRNHLLIEQEIAETPLIAGNNVRLLRDGEQTFDAVFAAIKGAKHHIYLEYYIFEDVKHKNDSLGDVLIKKRSEGVDINIIYDGFGSITTPAEFFERLRKAGIQVLEYHPINLVHVTKINNRDHRKILVVDGTQAIVGGVNLSATYESSRLRRSAGIANTKPEHWRDTDVLVKGPAANELQNLFIEHWKAQEGPELKDPWPYPSQTNKGHEIVRIIGSAPLNELPRYYVTLLSAIRNAEKSIYLSSAYFVPTEDEKKDLIAAAKRGVDVNIFVPGISDAKMAIGVQRSHYDDMLEAGIKIYESRHEVLHAKTIAIDGVWSVIGTSNFDHRSAMLNAEVDVVVIGLETARELKAMFDDDIKDATPITLAEWRKRPIWQRIKDHMSRFVEGML